MCLMIDRFSLVLLFLCEWLLEIWQKCLVRCGRWLVGMLQLLLCIDSIVLLFLCVSIILMWLLVGVQCMVLVIRLEKVLCSFLLEFCRFMLVLLMMLIWWWFWLCVLVLWCRVVSIGVMVIVFFLVCFCDFSCDSVSRFFISWVMCWDCLCIFFSIGLVLGKFFGFIMFRQLCIIVSGVCSLCEILVMKLWCICFSCSSLFILCVISSQQLGEQGIRCRFRWIVGFIGDGMFRIGLVLWLFVSQCVSGIGCRCLISVLLRLLGWCSLSSEVVVLLNYCMCWLL